jgi:hypothetical protein
VERKKEEKLDDKDFYKHRSYEIRNPQARAPLTRSSVLEVRSWTHLQSGGNEVE